MIVQVFHITICSCISSNYFSESCGHYTTRYSHAVCYLNDILIIGADDQKHLRNMEEVIKRLQYHGIHLK